MTAAPAPDARAAVRPAAPLVPAVAGAALVGVLALAALPGPVPLALLVLLVQAGLAAALAVLLGTPAARGVLVLGALAAVAADVAAVRGDGGVGPLAGVVALGLVAALLQQLALRDRERVTAGLAGILLVVVLVCCAACLVALRAAPGGRAATVVALAGGAAALLVGPLVGMLVGGARVAAAVGTVAVAVAVAVGAGALLASAPSTAGCVLLGLAAAVGGLAADLLLAQAAPPVGGPPEASVDAPRAPSPAADVDARLDPQVLQVAVLLLPVAVLGPLVLVAGRLVPA